MEHSLESYLSRQKTETLKMLLQQYEACDAVEDCYVARLIRSILAKRKKKAYN